LQIDLDSAVLNHLRIRKLDYVTSCSFFIPFMNILKSLDPAQTLRHIVKSGYFFPRSSVSSFCKRIYTFTPLQTHFIRRLQSGSKR